MENPVRSCNVTSFVDRSDSAYAKIGRSLRAVVPVGGRHSLSPDTKAESVGGNLSGGSSETFQEASWKYDFRSIAA